MSMEIYDNDLYLSMALPILQKFFYISLYMYIDICMYI